MNKYILIITAHEFSNQSIFEHYSKVVPADNIVRRKNDNFQQMEEYIIKNYEPYINATPIIIVWCSNTESLPRMTYQVKNSNIFKKSHYYTESFFDESFVLDDNHKSLSSGQLDSVIIGEFRKHTINDILND